MSRVFSGIQPTGNLHLGNYLGAIRNWVTMQDAHECIYCVVDLHAITMKHDPATLRSGIREMTAALLAAGIDPQRAILFPQSQVRVHAELAWVLMCTARVGWLNRMTQFKEKSGKDREGASVGLYTYPVLQAADILAYKATHVPVGDDQKQHLELARDIAMKFNTDMGVELFPLPEPVIEGPATRVMSLRDGSGQNVEIRPQRRGADQPDRRCRHHRPEDQARQDRCRTAAERAGRAGGAAGSGESGRADGGARPIAACADVLAEYGGQGFGAFKPALAEVMVATIAPITARFNDLRRDWATLDAVLADGAARARAIAEPVLRRSASGGGLYGLRFSLVKISACHPGSSTIHLRRGS